MKKILFVSSILLFFSGCTKVILGDVPPNNPESVFENFCEQINNSYAGKDVRGVNWDSLYKTYSPKINTQTNNSQLISVFQAMMSPFGDRHLDLKINGSSLASATSNSDYLNSQALEKSLNKSLKGYKNIFGYAVTANNIGYVAINTFDKYRFSQSDFEFFDIILDEMKDTKGLIIDIRTNGGGEELYAQLIAGRFTATPQLYKYTRAKIGVNKTDYTDFFSFTLQPRGTTYTKPVVVLTGNYTYSTANNFLMMLRLLPNITTIGNATGDGVVGSTTRELPNGWLLQCPSGLAFLPDKTAVEGSGGIKPKIQVSISAADKTNNVDAILNKALDLMK